MAARLAMIVLLALMGVALLLLLSWPVSEPAVGPDSAQHDDPVDSAVEPVDPLRVEQPEHAGVALADLTVPWLAGDVIGAVVDEEGRPVAEAVVMARPLGTWAASLQEDYPEHLEPVLAMRRCGADGRFRFTKVPAYGPMAVHVSRISGAAQETVARCRPFPGHTTDLGRLVLKRGAAIRGIVLANGTVPVADATVWAASWSGNGRDGPSTVSDAGGRFEINDLPSAFYLLRAEREGLVPNFPPYPHRYLRTGDRWDGVTIDVAHGRLVRGRVVGSDDRPVVGAQVETAKLACASYSNGNHEGGDREFAEAYTDEDGRFEILGFASDDQFRVLVSAGGKGRYREFVELPAGTEPVEIPEIRIDATTKDVIPVTTATAEFDPSHGVLRGTVRDADGGAVPYARVVLHEAPWETEELAAREWRDRREQWFVAMRHASREGVFEFRQLDEGWYALRVSTADFAPVWVDRIQVGPGRALRAVDVLLGAAAGSLAGRVIGLDGLGAAGVRIVAFRRDGTHEVAESDAAGAFHMKPLAPGTYRVRCDPIVSDWSKPPEIPQWEEGVSPTAEQVVTRVPACAEQVVTRVPACAEQVVVFDLRNGPYGAVSGTIRVNGKPASEVRVSVRKQLALTDRDGRYRLGPVPTGEFTVRVEDFEGFLGERRVLVEAGRLTHVDFDLSAARLEILVLDGRTGKPAVPSTIRVDDCLDTDSEREYGHNWSRAALGDGLAVVEHLPPGRYIVTAGPDHEDDLADGVAMVEVGKEERRRLVIHRELPCSLVLECQPYPNDWCEVELRRTDGWVRSLDDANLSEGRFELRNLPSGDYRVTVRSREPRRELAVSTAHLIPGKSCLIRLQLRLQSAR